MSFNLCDYFLGEAPLAEVGGRAALIRGDHALSYRQLRTEVEGWRARLREAGVVSGERVALLLFDSPEFIAAFLAAVAEGAVCVPINTFLTRDDVSFILADCGARFLIVESSLWEGGEGVPEGCKAMVVDRNDAAGRESRVGATGRSPLRPAVPTERDTPAFLLYTSGSTGRPKGVLHRHGAIPVTVENYSRHVSRLTPDDRLFSASRLFFAYGLGNSLSFPLAAGASVILEPARPTPESLARIFAAHRPTVFFGVPATYTALLDYRATGGALGTASLRLCVSAGEALPAPVFEAWERATGLQILDGIGSTEMLHIFISNREGAARAASSGRVVEGYAARLLDQDGQEITGDGPGNLWVRGASATAGYWGRPDLTDETIRDGWVRTGDLYRRDADGFYYHIGRSDDCFKVKGLWVSPVEVEAVLLAHEAVAEAAVVPAIGADGLATTRAYVVIRDDRGEGVSEAELLAFARSRLPGYKAPTQVEFARELPRTSTGKLQRFKLRG